MLRNIFVILLLAAVVMAADLKTEISQVTVYPGMAMVQRQATVRLQPGLNEITLQRLPAVLDDESVFAKLDAAPDVQLEDVMVERWFLQKAEEGQTRKLIDEILELEKKDKLAENQLKTLANQENFLTSIQSTTSTQAGQLIALGKADATAWTTSLNFVSTNLARVYDETVELEFKRNEIKAEKEALQKQLNEMQSAKPLEEKSITLALRAKSAASVVVKISYLVRDVSWWPSYEIRALPQSGKVEVVYSGHIRQKTGENWTGVDLVLSTASPSRGATAPELSPWDVQLWQERPMGMYKTSQRMAMAVQADMAAGAPQEVAEAEAPAPTMLETKSVSTQFAVTGKRDVLSGDEPAKVLITRASFDAEMAYLTIPKLSPFVYLQGKLTNSGEYPLLRGNALIYVDGDFVGRGLFQALAPGESVDLSLGIDEGLKVKRELVKKFDSNTGLVSKKHEVAFDYKITVENLKSQPVKLKLMDQLPRSMQDEIEVVDVKLMPDANEVEKESQKLIWSLELKPKEKKELLLHFKVSYPRDRQITGLE